MPKENSEPLTDRYMKVASALQRHQVKIKDSQQQGRTLRCRPGAFPGVTASPD
jgi:hypothetical protein